MATGEAIGTLNGDEFFADKGVITKTAKIFEIGDGFTFLYEPNSPA